MLQASQLYVNSHETRADAVVSQRHYMLWSMTSREPMGDAQDIEEECENAVFEVCDARERYPKRCAEELGKYLNLKNNISMEPVVLKPSIQTFDIPQISGARDKRISEDENARHSWDKGAEHLQRMINKIQELKVALKQLEDNKNFEMKHHLK